MFIRNRAASLPIAIFFVGWPVLAQSSQNQVTYAKDVAPILQRSCQGWAASHC